MFNQSNTPKLKLYPILLSLPRVINDLFPTIHCKAFPAIQVKFKGL